MFNLKIIQDTNFNKIAKTGNLKNIDLNGKPQHGFMKKRCTATAPRKLQSILAKAVDDGNFALMASLDLSSAFDVVNVDLLLKRL